MSPAINRTICIMFMCTFISKVYRYQAYLYIGSLGGYLEPLEEAIFNTDFSYRLSTSQHLCYRERPALSAVGLEGSHSRAHLLVFKVKKEADRLITASSPPELLNVSQAPLIALWVCRCKDACT